VLLGKKRKNLVVEGGGGVAAGRKGGPGLCGRKQIHDMQEVRKDS